MHQISTLHIALACLLQVGALGGGAQEEAADSAAPEARRTEEHFVIEQLDPTLDLDAWQLLGAALNSRAALDGALPPKEVGLVLWRRSESAAGRTLELDVRFPDRETRLLHLERVEPAGTTLIFREMQPQSGRTLCADWLEGGASLRLREWGGPQGSQERLDGVSGGLFVLELLEALRDEASRLQEARVFDPLSRRCEQLQVRTQWAGAVGPWAGTRRVELVRADGSLAGAYLLRGSEVLGFQWQAGNLRVRRIEAAEHSRRLESLLAPPVEGSEEP